MNYEFKIFQNGCELFLSNINTSLWLYYFQVHDLCLWSLLSWTKLSSIKYLNSSSALFDSCKMVVNNWPLLEVWFHTPWIRMSGEDNNYCKKQYVDWNSVNCNICQYEKLQTLTTLEVNQKCSVEMFMENQSSVNTGTWCVFQCEVTSFFVSSKQVIWLLINDHFLCQKQELLCIIMCVCKVLCQFLCYGFAL